MSSEKNPSAVHARALLGRLFFQKGGYDEAIRWWRGMDEGRRAAWGFDDPVRQTIFLAGLLAYREGALRTGGGAISGGGLFWAARQEAGVADDVGAGEGGTEVAF